MIRIFLKKYYLEEFEKCCVIYNLSKVNSFLMYWLNDVLYERVI